MRYLAALFAGMCVSTLAASASARHSRVNTSNVPSETVDVKQLPYGANGDGMTDDTASIQNAINASCAATNHPDVYFPVPSNCYKITSPIHVGCSGIAVHGQEGPGATKICSNYWGPVVMVESTGNNLLEYGPALVGKGHSLNTKSFPTDGKGYITLNEVLNNSAQSMNGLTSFNIEFWWEATTLTGSKTQWIFDSYTGNPGSNGVGAFEFQLFNNTSLKADAFFSASGRVTMPTVAVSANTIYDISLDDKAGTCRLFVNGTQVGTSQRCIGTLVQGPYESISLPAVNFGNWPDRNFDNTATTGYIDAIHVQKASVHTSNYTPAMSKPIPNSNTLVLVNFDRPTTQQAGTQPVYVAGSSTLNGFMSIHESGSQVFNNHISYLNLCPAGSGHPTGLFVNQSPNSEFDHLSCPAGSYIGLDFNNDTFQSTVHDNNLGGGVLCEYFADFTEGTIYNNLCSQSGVQHTCYLANASSYVDTYSQCQNQNNPGDIIYAWVDISTHIKHIFPFFDNEGNGTGLLGMFYIIRPYGPESIEHAEYGSSNNAPMLVQSGGPPTEIRDADFYVVNGTPAEVVDILSAPSGPILLENNLIPNGVPLSNNLAYIITPDKPPTVTVRTLPTCNALSQGQARNVTDCDSCVFGATCAHTTKSTFCRETCNGRAWVVQ
jgi:hypothetical protein